METGFVVLVMVLELIAGVLMGWLFARRRYKSDRALGYLYVIKGAPQGRDLFLTPEVPSSTIAKHKQVVFNVDVIDPDSRN